MKASLLVKSFRLLILILKFKMICAHKISIRDGVYTVSTRIQIRFYSE